MYEYNKVINGITKYVDTEIVDKLTGWQKWVVGGGIGIALSNATNLFKHLKENEFVKMLEIIDEDDYINVDKIYQEMKKQAQKGAITFNAPIVGIMTLNEQDVDKLYSLIKEV